MSPDASLLAVILAVCAALVACVAAGLVLLVTRLERASTGTRQRLVRTTSSVRHEGPRLRRRLSVTGDQADRLVARAEATDRRMVAAIGSMTSLRHSLEGLTQGRLATLIRGAGIVSKVAQFALLWR